MFVCQPGKTKTKFESFLAVPLVRVAAFSETQIIEFLQFIFCPSGIPSVSGHYVFDGSFSLFDLGFAILAM